MACLLFAFLLSFFFFKQKTAYEMRISDWSSDVCSSDLFGSGFAEGFHAVAPVDQVHADVEQALELEGLHLRAILFTLKLLLRLFVVVEIPFDPVHGTVEHIDGRPE